MNETPGRRTTVTSSFHEVSTDKQWNNRAKGGGVTPPHPHLLIVPNS
jgi:hypothetical protein